MQAVWDSETKVERVHTSSSGCMLTGPTISTANFVERCFIPNHVEQKTQAGRTHYHAILKHVLRPETVDRLFLPYRGMPRSKLKSIPEWPYLDDTRLCDISPEHVRHLTSLARDRGYSPQTVKHIKNVVSAIISHARKERILLGDNPIAEVHLPPVARKLAHTISLSDAKAIFGMMGYPERQIALIIFNTAMNVSEVCGLHWSRVNLAQAAVCVEEDMIPPRSILVKYQRTSWGLTRVNDDRLRTIEIAAPLLEILITLKRQRSGCGPDGFLFPNRMGTSMSPASILASKLKPIGRRLGIPISWHTLKEVRDAFLEDLCSKLNSQLAHL